MLVADVDGKSGQIAAGDLPLVVLLGEDCPSLPSPIGRKAVYTGGCSLGSLSSYAALLEIRDTPKSDPANR